MTKIKTASSLDVEQATSLLARPMPRVEVYPLSSGLISFARFDFSQ